MRSAAASPKAEVGPPPSRFKGTPGPAALRKLGFNAVEPCGAVSFPDFEPGEAAPHTLCLAQGGAAVLLDCASWDDVRTGLAALKMPVFFRAKPLQRCLLAAGLEPLEGILDLEVGTWLLHSTRGARDLAEAAALLGGVAVETTALPGLLEADLAELRERAQTLAALGSLLRTHLKEQGLSELYDSLERPLIPVLAGMENAGVKADSKVLDGLEEQAQKEMGLLRDRAIRAAGRDFNLNSPPQLAEILFKDLKLETGRKTKTGYSTDNEVLEALAEEHELPGLILEYRQLAKLSGTYLQALPKLTAADGRIHCAWNQSATATGRLSSTDPN
ncbi:MAG: DNA polymerase, partial [bacterium]